MPCHLFTYHGHSTWMPDHPRGYVHRQYGLQPSDEHMAEHYRHNQRDEPIIFSDAMQDTVINIARESGAFIGAIIHATATESTHVHVLVSWNHDRDWKSMRTSIRSAMSRGMNAMYGKREWFSDSPSRKRIRDHEHFDYLVMEYLPKHHRCWVREHDRIAAESRDTQRSVSVRERAERRKSGKHVE